MFDGVTTLSMQGKTLLMFAEYSCDTWVASCLSTHDHLLYGHAESIIELSILQVPAVQAPCSYVLLPKKPQFHGVQNDDIVEQG